MLSVFEPCLTSSSSSDPSPRLPQWLSSTKWILDVLICNWLGLYLGVKTCEYFEMKQYSWQGLAEIPTLKGKMKRTMQQFTPRSWTKFKWDSTKSFKSYCTVIFILTMVGNTRFQPSF